MHRRALLASVACTLPVALAGCTGERSTLSAGVAETPTARLEMTSVADAELPEKVLRTVGDDGPDRESRLLERIIDGGTTVEGTRPSFSEDRHLFYDDTVYQLSHEVTEQTPATRYSVKVDIVEGSVAESETVRFSDLPEVDRETFAENGLDGGDVIGIGTTLLYTDSERNQSVLVPDSDYSVIAWEDGSRAEWVVDDAYDTTLNTYRYTAERVASATEYGRQMRERFAFELSGLSDAQQDIVETAIEKGKYVVEPDETPSTALVSLVDRFRDQEQAHALDEDAEGGRSGSFLVQYGGEVYWTMLVAHSEAFRTETSNNGS